MKKKKKHLHTHPCAESWFVENTRSTFCLTVVCFVKCYRTHHKAIMKFKTEEFEVYCHILNLGIETNTFAPNEYEQNAFVLSSHFLNPWCQTALVMAKIFDSMSIRRTQWLRPLYVMRVAQLISHKRNMWTFVFLTVLFEDLRYL